MDDDEKQAIYDEFRALVNMTHRELESCLETEESRSVGWRHEDGGESVGHASGRRILELKRKRKADYSDEDYQHMRKVVGYVHRHTKQGPSGDPTHSRWRYSLMNWGHDPLKD